METNRTRARRGTLASLAATLGLCITAHAQSYVASLECRNSSVTIKKIEIYCETACYAHDCPPSLLDTFNIPNGPLSCNTPSAFGRAVRLNNVHQCNAPGCSRFAELTYTCNTTGGAEYFACLAVPTPGSGTKSSVGLSCPSGIIADAEFALEEAITVSGPGGVVPPSGTGGDGAPIWPTTMPSPVSMFSSGLTIDVPNNATRIFDIEIDGLTHTYAGDLQIVLLDPNFNRYNLVSRLGYTGTGYGSACDFGGTYTITDNGGTWPIAPCAAGGLIAPGTYAPNFGAGGGAWPDGASGVFNRALEDIPAVPGPWRLMFIDWAAGDVGSIVSWSMTVAVGDSPSTYCVPSVTSVGCEPAISADANPSATLATPCLVMVAGVEGARAGWMFYGTSGPNNAPWCAPGVSGSMCVRPPTQRTTFQYSGGTPGLCDGFFVLDWNAYQAANLGALGQPWSIGEKAFVQAWFRDPPACRTTGLSDAVVLTYQP